MSLESFISKFGKPADTTPDIPEALPQASLESFIKKFSGYSESYWFYNHTVEIRFDKEEHKYFRVDSDLGNLVPLYNVSTVCHIIDRSPALIPWAAKKTIEKLLRIMPTEITPEGVFIKRMSILEFEAIAIAAKSAHKDELEQAGDIGHEAHECIEKSILEALAHDPEKKVRELAYVCKDERAANCANAAFNWMQAHNVRWVCTEKKCYSKQHECSGTMDGKAIVDSCSDPVCCPTPFKDRLSIIDWKSSNYLYIEYLFQTAAYEAFEEEEHGENITDRWVIRLGKDDGEFDPWHLTEEDFAEDWRGFLACLELTKLVDAVNVRMKESKDKLKLRKKEAKQAAKALAKAQAKALREIEKARKKLERAADKKRIKEEAKRARDEAKQARLHGTTPESVSVVGPVPAQSPEVSVQPLAETSPPPLPEVKADTPAPTVPVRAAVERFVVRSYIPSSVSNGGLVVEEEPPVVTKQFTIPTD